MNALGPFKGVKEVENKGAKTGEHDFEAKFEKSTWHEVMEIDSDGKIAVSLWLAHDPRFVLAGEREVA